MKIISIPGLSALVLVAVSMFALPTANAVTQTRKLTVNGSGACQSALPVYDVQIHKRPKAVQNEGSVSAFVTCTYYSQAWQTDDYPTSISVYASGKNGQPGSITCTGVMGYQGTSYPYVAKTIALNESGGVNNMFWTAADFGGSISGPFPSGLFSISCNLGPGVGINDASIFFQEDASA